MSQTNSALRFFLPLAKYHNLLSRRLDARLGGLSFNELVILYQISQATDHKMRRIDLAEAVGLTASGVTRLLLPMEKIGLIKRQIDDGDARVSYVVLAPGGRTKLNEGLERLTIFGEDFLPTGKNKQIQTLTGLLTELAQNL